MFAFHFWECFPNSFSTLIVYNLFTAFAKQKFENLRFRVLLRILQISIQSHLDEIVLPSYCTPEKSSQVSK
jgi:hypothetical protein